MSELPPKSPDQALPLPPLNQAELRDPKGFLDNRLKIISMQIGMAPHVLLGTIPRRGVLHMIKNVSDPGESADLLFQIAQMLMDEADKLRMQSKIMRAKHASKHASKHA